VVRRTEFHQGGLFDSGQYSTTFEMTLRREDGAWKITNSDRYWAVAGSCPRAAGSSVPAIKTIKKEVIMSNVRRAYIYLACIASLESVAWPSSRCCAIC